jgi:hypothetical protein
MLPECEDYREDAMTSGRRNRKRLVRDGLQR